MTLTILRDEEDKVLNIRLDPVSCCYSALTSIMTSIPDEQLYAYADRVKGKVVVITGMLVLVVVSLKSDSSS